MIKLDTDKLFSHSYTKSELESLVSYYFIVNDFLSRYIEIIMEKK